jgi:DNA-binding transcriptional ArsR family regulator
MARAKTASFDPALVRTAALAKALAHPVRIRILQILAGRQGCICGGIVELLPLAQSTVSQHLKELRDAGLIRGDIDGPRTCYGLDARSVGEARAALAALFNGLCRPSKASPESRMSFTCRPCAPVRRASPRSGGRARPKSASIRGTGKEKP